MYKKTPPNTTVILPHDAIPPHKEMKLKSVPQLPHIKDSAEDGDDDVEDGKEKQPKQLLPPRDLYYSSEYMPKVADLRDAMRNNKIFHNRFNPALELPETKKYYSTALKPIP